MAFLQLLMSLSSYVNEHNIEEAITLVEKLIVLSQQVRAHQEAAVVDSSMNNNQAQNSSVSGS